jgi:hypothetical protein
MAEILLNSVLFIYENMKNDKMRNLASTIMFFQTSWTKNQKIIEDNMSELEN